MSNEPSACCRNLEEVAADGTCRMVCGFDSEEGRGDRLRNEHALLELARLLELLIHHLTLQPLAHLRGDEAPYDKRPRNQHHEGDGDLFERNLNTKREDGGADTKPREQFDTEYIDGEQDNRRQRHHGTGTVSACAPNQCDEEHDAEDGLAHSTELKCEQDERHGGMRRPSDEDLDHNDRHCREGDQKL